MIIPWYQRRCVCDIRSRVNRLNWFHFHVVSVVNPEIWWFLLFMLFLCRAIGLYNLLVSWRFSTM